MSSKLHSQIKVGDRVLCTATAADLHSIGIDSFNLSDTQGEVVSTLCDDWVDVLFECGVTFGVRIEHLKVVNRSNHEEVEEAVVSQIRKRRDAGRSKYGTTMERTDLTILQWVQHAQEEAMDFSIYLEKLKRVLKDKGIE